MRMLGFVLLFVSTAAIAQSHKTALGTSAAFDARGELWVAYVEGTLPETHVVLRSSRDLQQWTAPARVNATSEPISADGENRPKLAFGPKREMYVTWTSPTFPKYTGNIRFTRSLDQGRTWSAPATVHRDRQLITHRFESLLVDRRGRLWVTWVDRRDLHAAEKSKAAYAGAAVYYAWSDDQGDTWNGDFKLADHTCECCRIALALDPKGEPVALWRHVFENSERDHAFARLDTSGKPPRIQRATFDRWRIEACPHHGPGLAYSADGNAHAVWFNQVGDEGRAFYGRVNDGAPTHVRQLPAGATHADVIAAGESLAIAWKRFDGEATRIETSVSTDQGATFSSGPVLTATVDSDQPRLVSDGKRIALVWRTATSLQVMDLASGLRSNEGGEGVTAVKASTQIKPFAADTLAAIESQRRGRNYWVVLWDLECAYCMKSLRNLAQAQQQDPALDVVTISTDSVQSSAELTARLQELGVRGEHYAFADGSAERLRYSIDPKWLGEKPIAFKYAADGTKQAVRGVITPERFTR